MLSPRGLKMGLTAYAGLGTLFLINVHFLQPNNRATKRIVFPESASAPAGAADTRTNGSPALVQNAAYGPARSTSVEPPNALPAEPQVAPVARSSASGAELILAIQRELKQKGYETGTQDGLAGLVTRAAIMAYEWDNGLAITAEPSQALLQQILLGASAGLPGSKSGQTPGPAAEQVIRTVQQSLSVLGYGPLTVDGKLGADTVRAIRKFEQRQALRESGRISGELVAKLARLAGEGRLSDSR
jgi:peptidoglycan hydrolase-like protein with peptidoglycan-binding domain